MKRAVVVFAAGQGTRMKSLTPKVMHTIAGKAMLDYVLETADSLHPDQIVLITSKSLLKFLESNPKALRFDMDKITFQIQEPALGSGHAMQCGLDALQADIEEIIVLFGDVPFVERKTLQPLLDQQVPLCMLAMRVPPPHAYGRMILDGDIVERIVEAKDASASELAIDLVWTGVLKVSKEALSKYLTKLTKSPVTGEYYLTELVQIMRADQQKVSFVEATDATEFEGINDKFALSVMEKCFQEKKRKELLLAGVKMIAPETVYFSYDTQIEQDATIHPFVTFGPKVVVKSAAEILPHCHIEDSVIGQRASIGPFAHLRGGNVIGEKVAVGNFVEVKKSKLHSGAKIKHLSYIGDAELFDKVNVGAGTITCNYDGQQKHKTIIEENSFIGANVTLVAPVKVGASAKVAAGSVITQDVPSDMVAFGRARQENKAKKQ